MLEFGTGKYRELMDAKNLIEKKYEWIKWRTEIPYINWPSDWLVKAIPPSHCMIIRYNIKHKDNPNSFVSVYLDCYDELGCVGKPYWEVYPVGNHCGRCLMNETDELLSFIKQSLDEQVKK